MTWNPEAEMHSLPSRAMTLRAGRVPGRVQAHRDRLLAVKHGVCKARRARRNRGNTWQNLGSPLPWAEGNARRKELQSDFEGALVETRLPKRPDYEAPNRILIKARQGMAPRPSTPK